MMNKKNRLSAVFELWGKRTYSEPQMKPFLILLYFAYVLLSEFFNRLNRRFRFLIGNIMLAIYFEDLYQSFVSAFLWIGIRQRTRQEKAPQNQSVADKINNRQDTGFQNALSTRVDTSQQPGGRMIEAALRFRSFASQNSTGKVPSKTEIRNLEKNGTIFS
jgi:hypothetical protein